MESLKQYSLLLSVMAFLLLLKFAVVPLYEWQNEQLQRNMLLQKQLSKAKGAVESLESNQDSLMKTDMRLTMADQLVYPKTDNNAFQLVQQQRLEQLFGQHEIVIESLGWETPVSLPQWQLMQHEVFIRFKGRTDNMRKLHMALESQPQWQDLNWLNYRLRNQSATTLGRVSGGMRLRLYSREGQL